MKKFSVLILCLLASSGYAQDSKPAHFHHVRLNVTNPGDTLKFFTRNFGATETNYRGNSRALYTERSFILLNEVAETPRWKPHTAISHIGWATTDGPSTYEWLKKNGVEFETHIDSLGANQGMYVYGPDKELVEVWTGSRNHRFEHIHMWATDVEKSAGWYRDHLGLAARIGPQPTLKDRENIAAIRMGFLQCDNVNLVIFGKPDFESRWWPGGSYKAEDAPKGDFKPTKGSTINHIAFSYRDITPVFDRMKKAGVKIVEPISKREPHGHTSFFVEAPDHVLVEIVQAKPIPEGIWED
jgi:catechol 2,3-dioxygenase-like lactoylglutathione lyase family enzyme